MQEYYNKNVLFLVMVHGGDRKLVTDYAWFNSLLPKVPYIAGSARLSISIKEVII